MLDSLSALVEKVQRENEELREQVSDLLERGGKSSRCSSKPRSSDSAAQRAARQGKRRSERSGCSKGAQPGHERTMLPESAVDELHRYFPNGTCRCGASVRFAAEPHCCHQVFDLSPVRVTVFEHQLFGGVCDGCDKRHLAQTPTTVPSGQMGPGLIAWIATLS